MGLLSSTRHRVNWGDMRRRPLHEDERGVWVSLAAVLMVAIFAISLSVYYVRVLPELQKQQESTYSSLAKQDFISFANKISQLTPGKSVTISAPVAVTPAGTQVSVDAFFSLPVAVNPTLMIKTFNTRQDYLEGMDWSENGLHENIWVGDGYITLDNEWWGNTFITNTHRDVDYEITSYSNLVSFRFVAEKTGVIENIWFWVYVYTSDYPALRVEYQDNTYEDLYPIEDAQTNSGSSTTNYGADTDYIIGATTTRAYRVYMKFDLSRIQQKPVRKALLALSCYDNDYVSSTGAPLQVYSTSDSWNEDSITWSTQPAEITLLAENTIKEKYVTYYWDITNYIQSEMAGDNIASVVIRAANETPTEAKDASFNSMEKLSAEAWNRADNPNGSEVQPRRGLVFQPQHRVGGSSWSQSSCDEGQHLSLCY
ncbi:MAG: DNRLRE domain-containing protein [Candidatus Hadarchaeales archaeon]